MARYIPKSNKSLIVLEEHLESWGSFKSCVFCFGGGVRENLNF